VVEILIVYISFFSNFPFCMGWG